MLRRQEVKGQGALARSADGVRSLSVELRRFDSSLVAQTFDGTIAIGSFFSLCQPLQLFVVTSSFCLAGLCLTVAGLVRQRVI